MLSVDGKETEIKGGHLGPTTNNRMELQAAIEALKLCPLWSEVEMNTDSKYLRNGAMTWIKLWKKRNWISKEGSPVKNQDLWRELDDLMKTRRVKWKWVKAHQLNGNANDRCDTLANEARIGSRLSSLILNYDATDQSLGNSPIADAKPK